MRKAIAFVDCCGYSAYTVRRGNHAAVQMHLRLRHHLEREAAAAKVIVIKWIGDGAMLAADTSHPILACIYQTMLALRSVGSLPLRGGVTFGPVVAVEYETIDYFGMPVNRAAALCAAASPWQIRAETRSGRQMHYKLRSSDGALT